MIAQAWQKRWRLLVLVVGMALLVNGCGAPASFAVACTTAYRASVSAPPGEQAVLLLDRENRQQMVAYEDLELLARLDDEAAVDRTGWTLRVVVRMVGEENVMQATLYQLPLDGLPINQFRGGHGFTGLTYAYHPVSNAELQFWCEARP